MDRCRRIYSAHQLDSDRTHLQIQNYGRQFQFWLGDGADRRVAGLGTRIQQSVWAGYGADGVGTSAIPVSDRWSVQYVRDLFQSVGVRAADVQ